MPRPRTLRSKIEERIARKKGDSVFLTREFKDLSDEDQVLRVLRTLVRDKKLVRLGYGVYGRAFVSSLTGKAVLLSPGGFRSAWREALDKLGVDWEPTESEKAYNEDGSTQIPFNPVAVVKGRFSRRLHDGTVELRIVRQTNA